MRYRTAVLMCIFLVIYLFLGGLLAYHQIFKGPQLAREAASMRNRTVALKETPRGAIYDRNHLLLTDCHTSTALYCLPQELNISDSTPELSRSQILARAAAVLCTCMEDTDRGKIELVLQKAAAEGVGIIRLSSDLNSSEIQKIEESGLSGVITAPEIKRYRSDGLCSHLIGYIGKGGDYSGKAGLEKLYNDILEGSGSSQEIVSVKDGRGITIKGLMFRIRREQEKEQGCLVLTIDSRIQELVERVMDQKIQKGAVVVMDINSREVLAMASRPTFSPYADIQQLIQQDERSSLSNRALSRYHPGSIFKILVSAAALEEQTVQVNDRFFCNGHYTFTDQLSISCWKEEGHGSLDFSEAFALSCNPSFIEVSLELGRERLMEYVEKFHLTDETLLGYGADQNYSYVKIEPARPALANVCLGQQGVMLTPLEITSMIATIADDGRWQYPSIVKYTVNPEGIKTTLVPGEKEQVISAKTARIIQELMKKTVKEGTGKTAALGEVQVAGKTATSQEGRVLEGEEERDLLNTWFGGFFPTDNPRWAIVVLAEDGLSGAKNAAPVFKDIAQGMLKYYPAAGEK